MSLYKSCIFFPVVCFLAITIISYSNFFRLLMFNLIASFIILFILFLTTAFFDIFLDIINANLGFPRLFFFIRNIRFSVSTFFPEFNTVFISLFDFIVFMLPIFFFLFFFFLQVSFFRI
jgi:hypothetical protein